VRPVGNFAQQFYDVEGNLIKRDAKGAVIWSVGTPFNWTFGEDAYGGVHVGGDGGDLGRYDYDGNLVWKTNFSSRCTAMVLDPFGNRFISFADGSVSRVSGETIFAPNIISNLQGQTVLAGSNYTIRVTASGSAPLTYSWYLNGSLISNKTSATLALTNLTMAHAGTYTVVVSNFAGSVTSAPALLRVKSVALFLGNQLLTNGVYTFASAPSLSIRFSYPNGSAFYTLDGSTARRPISVPPTIRLLSQSPKARLFVPWPTALIFRNPRKAIP
jgi:hypothetical protein